MKKESEVLPGTGTGELSAKAKFLQGPIASEATQVTSTASQTAFIKTVPIVACHPTILVRACTIHRCRAVSCRRPLAPRGRSSAISLLQARVPPSPGPTVNEGIRYWAGTAAIDCASASLPSAAVQSQSAFRRVSDRPLSYACRHCLPHLSTRNDKWSRVPRSRHVLPQEPASLACDEQITVVGGFAAHAQQQQPAPMPAATAVAVCHVTEANCPTVAPVACNVTVATRPCPPPPTRLCPTPLHHCPSQLCPTPLHHCPSVNNFHCPPTTPAAGCHLPTPNIQHCPAPNDICPRPTNLPCPSVTDVCPTSSPIFCELSGEHSEVLPRLTGWRQGLFLCVKDCYGSQLVQYCSLLA